MIEIKHFSDLFIFSLIITQQEFCAYKVFEVPLPGSEHVAACCICMTNIKHVLHRDLRLF